MILTYRYRIKDRATRKHLERHARAVNFVWNYLCETQRHAQAWRRRWPTQYDLQNLCVGSTKELKLHSDTISEICRAFTQARDAKRKCPKFRSYKKNLGWIPMCGRFLPLVPGGFKYLKRKYFYWNSRALPSKPKTLSISQDARGRWYVNFQCEVMEAPKRKGAAVGIDLGLKEFAVLSDGNRIENPRFFRTYEGQLAVAQRARNKRRVAAIHAKISNARKDFLHKHSTRLVQVYSKIVVGDVNAAQLMQTSMAKSVSDASWSAFRTMLRYKAMRHGAEFIEADERYSSSTCSACGVRSGPKGRKGLSVREWGCSHCGSVHDRDQNAALNILSFGAECRPPSEGSLSA